MIFCRKAVVLAPKMQAFSGTPFLLPEAKSTIEKFINEFFVLTRNLGCLAAAAEDDDSNKDNNPAAIVTAEERIKATH